MRKLAFTLSEVLVTLGIIGVVAVLTVPNMYANVNKKTMLATLKDSYSKLSGAMIKKMADEQVYNWNDVLPEDDADLPSFTQEFLTEYLDVVKVCNSFDECFADNYTSIVTSSNDLNYFRDYFAVGNSVLLNNKSAILFYISGYSYSSNAQLHAYIDVNGKLGPNKLGIDYFLVPLDYKGNAVTDEGAEGYYDACVQGGVDSLCFDYILKHDWEPIK